MSETRASPRLARRLLPAVRRHDLSVAQWAEVVACLAAYSRTTGLPRAELSALQGAAVRAWVIPRLRTGFVFDRHAAGRVIQGLEELSRKKELRGATDEELPEILDGWHIPSPPTVRKHLREIEKEVKEGLHVSSGATPRGG